MFWKKQTSTNAQSNTKVKKLPGPKWIPDMVGGHLVVDYNENPDWVWKLRAVTRPRDGLRKAYDVRDFDEVQAALTNIKIRDYNSFDEHPELIIYEGWFDNDSLQVQLERENGTT
ncbi:MAG TPA: hypothetical protein G4O06_00425 [Dehalococcoidia bacterium]|nr:hypothetical protein [Dehalococcoidia bacterium]